MCFYFSHHFRKGWLCTFGHPHRLVSMMWKRIYLFHISCVGAQLHRAQIMGHNDGTALDYSLDSSRVDAKHSLAPH